MRFLLAWTKNEKHPETPRLVYKNVWGYDQVRRVLKGRCAICGYVVSSDAKAVKEIAFKCGNSQCDCNRMYGATSHQVCSLCYDMFYSLYANYGMKDMNYFKNLDEKDKKDFDDYKKRSSQ